MNIKLRRAAWDSEEKVTLENIGAELILPTTFSLNDVSVSKNITSVTNRFSSNFLKSGYNKNSITIKGVIFLDGNQANAEALKDEIVSYVTVPDERMIIKIYQEKNDNKYWLGINSDVNITYSERRSVIDITLTFELEEPFRLGETLIVISGNQIKTFVQNDSNVAFYPENILSQNASIVPVWADGESVESDIETILTTISGTVEADVNLKTFTGDTGNLGNGCLGKLLQIPAGDFYITMSGLSTPVLKFYERWL